MPFYLYTLTPSGWPAPSAAPLGLAHEPAHGAQGLARVISQYSDAERLRGFLSVLLDGTATIPPGGPGPTGVQSVEDVLWALYTSLDLVEVEGGGPAEGVQLDLIGALVGESRRETYLGSDDIYRTYIRAGILANRSTGEPEDLYEILEVIAEFDRVAMREPWPAFVELYLSGSVLGFRTVLDTVRTLRRAKAGGVGLHVISTDAPWTDVFRWSGTHGVEEATTTYGWGSVHDPGIPGGEWPACYARTPI